MSGLLERREQLPDREAVIALVLIRLLPASGRDDVQQLLAAEGASLPSVGPAMLEDEVLPLLQQRRRAVPEEGVLENDDVVGDEQRLLARHVDVEIGICLVEVVDGETLALRQLGQEAPMHPRSLEGRMRELDEDTRHD